MQGIHTTANMANMRKLHMENYDPINSMSYERTGCILAFNIFIRTLCNVHTYLTTRTTKIFQWIFMFVNNLFDSLSTISFMNIKFIDDE